MAQVKCFEQTVGVKKDLKSCDSVLLIFYCCKFKVPVSTDIFPQTNWLILQIIVCGFISMFVHHNLARNSIVKYGSIAKYCSLSNIAVFQRIAVMQNIAVLLNIAVL